MTLSQRREWELTVIQRVIEVQVTFMSIVACWV
jgi:hypothetical protein